MSSDWEDATKAVAVETLPLGERRSRAYLIVLGGSNVGEMFKISRSGVVVGRAADADITLVDDGVSRRHARIAMRGDSVVIEDMGSLNGVHVNGKQIASHTLADGDKIQLGGTAILKFAYHDDLDESFQKQMFDSALKDDLTGAFNKRYLIQHLENEIKFALKTGAPLSLLMMDLDHFKQINDTHGHVAGDRVLRDVAAHISGSLRTDDIFGRYGGEEFAVICRNTPEKYAGIIAERIRNGVAALSIEHERTAIPATLSLGVAELHRVGVDVADQLIEAADAALYEAKEAGRNRVMFASEGEPKSG